MLYEKWINAVELNKALQAQILQLGKDKGALEKEVDVLKREILKNNTAQFELEQLKRVRMLNSRTTSLVIILCMVKTPEGHEGD